MTKTKHFMVLDGLRGVAALTVLSMHAAGQLGIQQFASHGYLAVDFFFMLSGVVMASAYEQRLIDGRMPFSEFAKVRLIRLYPLIALGTILGAVSMFGHVHRLLATGTVDPHIHASYAAFFISLVMGMLILPFGPLGRDMMPLDLPLWSLILEIIINLVYAGVVRFLTRPVLGIVIGVSAIIFIFEGLYFGNLGLGLLDKNFFIDLARVSASFFIGVALLRLFKRGSFNRLPKIPGLLLAVLLLASFVYPDLHGDSIYCLACILVLYPLIIISGLFDVVAARWRPAVAMAGRLSYPVYALHKPIIDHLTSAHTFHGAARFGALLAIIGIVVVIGYAATVLYDEPVRAWLQAHLRRPRAPIASPLEAAD